MKNKISISEKDYTFSEETIRSFEELGEVLYRIHMRLLREGKIKVVDGKTVFLKEEEYPR